MTSHRISIIAAIALLAGAAALYAQENVNDLIRELSGGRPVELAPAQWEAAHGRLLDALLADLGSDDAGRRGGAQSTVERIAFNASRPGAEVERAACSRALAARAVGQSAPLAKVWLIRQLERIGRAEAVGQLATLLGSAEGAVRESARRALIKNPAAEAGAALRRAMALAEGPWRVALINALGDRRESANLSALLKEAASQNEEARLAALRALGKLGDKAAVETVAAAMDNGSGVVRQVATDAFLMIAENLAGTGDAAGALGLYRRLLPAPGHLKCAAIVGIGRSGSAADLSAVFDCAGDPDVRLRGACVEAMALMKGEGVTAAIVSRIGTASAEAKATLLQGLARRGERNTAGVFVAGCEDANEAVRVEAIRGLGLVGDASAAPLLLRLAAGAGAIQEAARWSLARLEGAGVDQAIMTATGDANTSIRQEAIRATVSRHIEAAAPALLKAAEDVNSPTRGESIKALGSLGSTEALEPVAAILLTADSDGIRQEAAGALARIAGREADPDKRSEAILKALAGSSGPARVALLGIMPRVGGERSLEAVRGAIKDGDEKVKDAAIRALADWQDASAAEDLLGIARSAPSETHQVLAVRGCIRMVREARNRPPAERCRLLVAALEAAKRADEKRQAISALGEVRTTEALRAVVLHLGSEGLAQESAQAAVRIGRDVANDNPEAVKEAMQKVLESTNNQDLQRQAREALDRAEQRIRQKAGR